MSKAIWVSGYPMLIFQPTLFTMGFIRILGRILPQFLRCCRPLPITSFKQRPKRWFGLRNSQLWSCFEAVREVAWRLRAESNTSRPNLLSVVTYRRQWNGNSMSQMGGDNALCLWNQTLKALSLVCIPHVTNLKNICQEKIVKYSKWLWDNWDPDNWDSESLDTTIEIRMDEIQS